MLRDEYIDWNNESELIIRKIRSRSPQRLSVTYLKSKKRILYKSKSFKIKNYNFVNGQVIDKDKKGILVKTADNAIWLNLGSFDKKIFNSVFKIGTEFYAMSIGNTLKLENQLRL